MVFSPSEIEAIVQSELLGNPVVKVVVEEGVFAVEAVIPQFWSYTKRIDFVFNLSKLIIHDQSLTSTPYHCYLARLLLILVNTARDIVGQ